MLIEIHSDIVCPWCYLGLTRFDAALAAHPGREDVTVVHRPFQLDPDAAREPQPVLAALTAKFGSAEKAQASIDQVQRAAAEQGLPLRMDRAQSVNTFDAHRLVALAARSESADDVTTGPTLQQRVLTGLMQAYFVEGRNIADHAELAAVAKEAGLTGLDVNAYLSSGAGAGDVRDQLAEGRALGLDSVPTFVFERRWAVSGAQSVDTMAQVLQQIETAMLGGGGGGCCGGGCCGGGDASGDASAEQAPAQTGCGGGCGGGSCACGS